ncbi:MAG: WbqC family protein [Myxococcota bacterium]
MTTTAIGIHQPNFLPWLGYFAKMNACDIFVFLDDAQFSKNSYINRVRLQQNGAARWFTVPVQHNGLHQTIGETLIAPGHRWRRKHMGTLQAVYRRAPHYRFVMDRLAPLYDDPPEHLADFNILLIQAIAHMLGIDTPTRRASEVGVDETSTDRLVTLVRAYNGTTYISGKGGATYQDPQRFKEAGVTLDVRAYQPIPYPQPHEGPFLPGLSAIDALFARGPDARELLTYPPLEDTSEPTTT